MLLVFVAFLAVACAVDFEPIPPESLPKCKNCSTKGYDIIQTGDGVFALTDGQYWAMAVVSSRSGNTGSKYNRYDAPRKTLAVVDAPPTFVNYIAALEELMGWTGAQTVTDLILSHHHKDHIDLAGDVVRRWPQARVIGHTNLKTVLTDGRDLSNRPVPTITFKKSMRLENYGLELMYPFQTNTSNNIIVYHARSKTILFIDVIFPKWIPFKEFAVSESVPGFVKAYDTILSYDFDTIIAGHLTTLGTRDDVLQGQEFIQDVMDAAGRALATVDAAAISADVGVNDPSSSNFGNFWAVFYAILVDCANRCYDEVSSKWLGVIGAVDVWTPGHCETACESHRLD